MENVILYTTHCPRCLILANKLQEKGIHYTEFTDVQKMLESNKGRCFERITCTDIKTK